MFKTALLLAVGLGLLQALDLHSRCSSAATVPGCQGLFSCQVQNKLCVSYLSCHTIAAAGLAPGHSWAIQDNLPNGSLPTSNFLGSWPRESFAQLHTSGPFVMFVWAAATPGIRAATTTQPRPDLL